MPLNTMDKEMLEPAQHINNFNLKRAIELSRGISHKIAGGTGLSKDDPIIVTETFFPFVPELEKEVISAACEFYGFFDPIVHEMRLKKYDRIVMHEADITYSFEDDDGEAYSKRSTLYFDISLPYSSKRDEFNSDELLRKYDERTDDKNAKAIEHPRDFTIAVREALTEGEIGLNDFLAIAWEDMEKDRQINEALKECGALDSFNLVAHVT